MFWSKNTKKSVFLHEINIILSLYCQMLPIGNISNFGAVSRVEGEGLIGSFGFGWKPPKSWLAISKQNFWCTFFWFIAKFTTPQNSANFPENIKNPIIQRNVNIVRELWSRAHFKDKFMLFKNQIWTMPLKFLVFLLRGVL